MADRDQAVIDSLEAQALQAADIEGARRGHDDCSRNEPSEGDKPLTWEDE